MNYAERNQPSQGLRETRSFPNWGPCRVKRTAAGGAVTLCDSVPAVTYRICIKPVSQPSNSGRYVTADFDRYVSSPGIPANTLQILRSVSPTISTCLRRPRLTPSEQLTQSVNSLFNGGEEEEIRDRSGGYQGCEYRAVPAGTGRYVPEQLLILLALSQHLLAGNNGDPRWRSHLPLEVSRSAVAGVVDCCRILRPSTAAIAEVLDHRSRQVRNRWWWATQMNHK